MLVMSKVIDIVDRATLLNDLQIILDIGEITLVRLQGDAEVQMNSPSIYQKLFT